MFTGIIQDVGAVTAAKKQGNGLLLLVRTSLNKKVNLGDSIAVNGTCLTVTGKKDEGRMTKDERRSMLLTFDAIPETISRTTLLSLKAGDKVNVEPAICAGEPFGGHFVQGHIDNIGTITDIKKERNEYLITIGCPGAVDAPGLRRSAGPSEMTAMIAEKGSIAIDGVSLTVVNVGRNDFTVALIPFTLKQTILGDKKSGDRVNIELDIIGKWVNKLVNSKVAKTPARLDGGSGKYSDEGF